MVHVTVSVSASSRTMEISIVAKMSVEAIAAAPEAFVSSTGAFTRCIWVAVQSQLRSRSRDPLRFPGYPPPFATHSVEICGPATTSVLMALGSSGTLPAWHLDEPASGC